jgi:hypothetical protein
MNLCKASSLHVRALRCVLGIGRITRISPFAFRLKRDCHSFERRKFRRISGKLKPFRTRRKNRCSSEGDAAIGCARVGRRQNKSPVSLSHRAFCFGGRLLERRMERVRKPRHRREDRRLNERDRVNRRQNCGPVPWKQIGSFFSRDRHRSPLLVTEQARQRSAISCQDHMQSAHFKMNR